MGEIIRNLKEIHLGNSTFMLELNEGYSKSQGRIIHIQNNDFRYVVTEKEFLHLSSIIMKARIEMEYYKNKEILRLEETIREKTSNIYVDWNIKPDGKVLMFIGELDKGGIDYRILEHREKLTTILVNPKDAKKAERMMRQIEYAKEIKHTQGQFFGYRFLYQMKPFQLYSINDSFVEVFFQLPCMSLTPNTWIPLDRCVQERVWSEQHKDSEGYAVIDDVCHYIYRLTWAVFKKKKIDNKDICFFENNSTIVQDENFKRLIEKVFFKYTDTLISLLVDRKYDSVILEFYKFSDY